MYTVYVKDSSGNEAVQTIDLSYVDNTISVTHPISVSYTIDPNTGILTAPNITITNNNQHIGLEVSILSFVSSDIKDVMPNAFANWNTLMAAQTQLNLAIGIGVKEQFPSSGGWASIINNTTEYAAQITSPVELGILNAGGSGNLSLSANFGLAWSNQRTVTQSLTLIFTACNVN